MLALTPQSLPAAWSEKAPQRPSKANAAHRPVLDDVHNALAYPGRIESGAAFLDLFQIAKLEFEAPDFKRFPCLRLAFEALKAGGSAPGALNAANEEAVAAFLVGHIRFIDIANVVQAVLERMAPQSVATLEAVLAVDQLARQIAQQAIASCGSK